MTSSKLWLLAVVTILSLCSLLPQPLLATSVDTPSNSSSSFCGKDWDDAGQCFGKFADGYNLFTSQDATLSNSDVEGRLAVGGTATLSSYLVGLKLGYEKCPTSFTLDSALVVAARKLSWSNGKPANGNVVSAAFSLDSAVLSSLEKSRCSALKYSTEALETIINSTRTDIGLLQNYLSTLSANAKVDYNYGGVLITCTASTTDNHVAWVDGSKMLSSTYMTLTNCRKYNSLVINVVGTKAGFKYFGFPKEIIASKTIFNFFSANQLVIEGVGVQGHILALGASLDGGQGSVDGQVFLKSAKTIIQCNWVPCRAEIKNNPVSKVRCQSSSSPSPSPTYTPSQSPSRSPSSSSSPSRSPSSSPSPSQSPCRSPSSSSSPSRSPSSTPSVSVTPSITPSITPSSSPSSTPSVSMTPCATPSITPSSSPSITASVSSSLCPSVSSSTTPSVSPSVTPSVTPSTTASASASVTPSFTPSPSSSPLPPSNTASPVPQFPSSSPCFGSDLVLNVLTFRNFESSSDVQGRLFVGGNATLGDGFSVGDQLNLTNCQDPNVDSINQTILFVANQLNWFSGNPYSGHIRAASGEGVGAIVNNSLIHYGCSLIQDERLIEMGDLMQAIYSHSTAALALFDDSTVSVSISQNQSLRIVFAPGSTRPVQVVSLNATLLGTFSSFTLVNYDPTSSFLLFNIYGLAGARLESIDFEGLVASRTLFNFFEYTGALPISNIRVEGSILAPFADIIAGSGTVVGQVIANSAVGSTSPFAPSLQYNHVVCVGLPISDLLVEI